MTSRTTQNNYDERCFLLSYDMYDKCSKCDGRLCDRTKICYKTQSEVMEHLRNFEELMDIRDMRDSFKK